MRLIRLTKISRGMGSNELDRTSILVNPANIVTVEEVIREGTWCTQLDFVNGNFANVAESPTTIQQIIDAVMSP